MVNTSGEINALLNLIEDPDEEVFGSITARFIGFGLEVIPFLEEHKLHCTNEELIRKTDYIIASISLSHFSNAIKGWYEGDDKSILEAALIISTYLEKEMDRDLVVTEIERLRKSIWLELNDYLTPLEEINVINKIIFGYFNITGNEITYTEHKDFDLCQSLFGKNGNALPIGALYLVMGEMLGIPIKPVDIPKQHLLCYAEAADPFAQESKEIILFYIDPLNGQVYTHRDIENYLKKINHTPYPYSIGPSENYAYIRKWIVEIAHCAKEKLDDHTYGILKNLARIIE